MKARKKRVRYLSLFVFCLTGGVLMQARPARAWNGVEDNKQLAELERMLDFELASEGRKACLTATMAQLRAPARAQRLGAEAHEYLDEVGHVAQQLYMQGKEMPAWVGQMHQAIDQQAPLTCHASWEHVMKEHLEQLMEQLNDRLKHHLPGNEQHQRREETDVRGEAI